jgi:cyanophycin synthetase
MELGKVAAEHFDVVVVREDAALRGRARGATAALIADGITQRTADGARCKQVEIVLDEIDATRHAMSRANRGDLVVICVDKHAAVVAELESWSHRAQAGAHTSDEEPVGDPDMPAHAAAAVQAGPV